MAIKTYKKDSYTQLTANFNQREFDCKCGRYCSTTKISEELVERLQALREKLGKPIKLTSGYRCARHNANVGGARNSNHAKGKAADIVCDGVAPATVAKAAEECGFRGIILYTARKFVHVDVRSTKYFAKDNDRTVVKVSTFGGKSRNPYTEPSKNLRRGSTGNGVKWVQWELKAAGYAVAVDGDFGAKTQAAVRAFQKAQGLTSDGIVGKVTRAKLKAN